MPHDHNELSKPCKPHSPHPIRQPLSPNRKSVTVTACHFLLRDERKTHATGFYDIRAASVTAPHQPPLLWHSKEYQRSTVRNPSYCSQRKPSFKATVQPAYSEAIHCSSLYASDVQQNTLVRNYSGPCSTDGMPWILDRGKAWVKHRTSFVIADVRSVYWALLGRSFNDKHSGLHRIPHHPQVTG